jgi:predicted nucleic acid-binding protein
MLLKMIAETTQIKTKAMSKQNTPNDHIPHSGKMVKIGSKAKQEAEKIVEMFKGADYTDLSIAGAVSVSIIYVEGIDNVHCIYAHYESYNAARLNFYEEVKQELEKML